MTRKVVMQTCQKIMSTSDKKVLELQEPNNKSVRRVLAVAASFPSPKFPEHYIFVRNILLEMARQGADVDVIVPLSWLTALKTWKKKPQKVDYGTLKVRRPIITTIPLQYFDILKKPFNAFNDRSMQRAIERCLPKDVKYDFCYTHFLHAGRAALEPMSSRGIPVLLNFGEGCPWEYDELYAKDDWIKELSAFAGIIAVSKCNQTYLVDRDPSLAEKVRYIPNGVDIESFKSMDRQKCRKILGLPQDEKFVIFCGHFEERKGPLRVLEAIRRVDIKGVFLGVGDDKPEGPEVLFVGSVVNDELPLWLNAADLFVMPSLAEGMCNAILEAMACGLPLVVSDRDFNREFLTDDCAEFVDPMDTESICEGIRNCLRPSRSRGMSNAAVSLAKTLSIQTRIKRIFNYTDSLGGITIPVKNI